MIQIRSNVFETNSSSTHSICIQKKPVDADYSYIAFHAGEYGWEERIVNLGNYLYTAIINSNFLNMIANGIVMTVAISTIVMKQLHL